MKKEVEERRKENWIREGKKERPKLLVAMIQASSGLWGMVRRCRAVWSSRDQSSECACCFVYGSKVRHGRQGKALLSEMCRTWIPGRYSVE